MFVPTHDQSKQVVSDETPCLTVPLAASSTFFWPCPGNCNGFYVPKKLPPLSETLFSPFLVGLIPIRSPKTCPLSPAKSPPLVVAMPQFRTLRSFFQNYSIGTFF